MNFFLYLEPILVFIDSTGLDSGLEVIKSISAYFPSLPGPGESIPKARAGTK